MSKIMCIDATLNAAVRLKFTSNELEELAIKLRELGLKQAEISIFDCQRFCPELSRVQEHLELHAMIDASEYNPKLLEYAGIKNITIIYSARSLEILSETIKTAMTLAERLGLKVSLLLDGGYPIAAADLALIANRIRNYPLAAVILGDRLATFSPFMMYEQIAILKGLLNCPIGVRAGNPYGMATANTLAGLKAGADRAVTAVAGIGGLAPYEEVLMAANQLAGGNHELPQNLAVLCCQVLAEFGLSTPERKAIIGCAVFAHESGLHADGVIKDPVLYEPFSPDIVGLQRRIVIGKHSGSAALRGKFLEMGISLEEDEAQVLLAKVRAMAVIKRRSLTSQELRNLYTEN